MAVDALNCELIVHLTCRWKVSNMTAMLQLVVDCCGDKLEGLGLAGWGGLKSDHLELLAQRCPKLSRIDLTSINVGVRFL